MTQGSRRLERGLIAALWGVPLLLLLGRCAATDALPFVVQSAGAPWIRAPEPVSAALQQWGEVEVPAVNFLHRAALAERPADRTPGRLRLRALGSVRAWLDGAEIAAASAAGRGPVEVGAELSGVSPGAHELRVEVRNARGPALLSVRGEGAAAGFSSSVDWSVLTDDGSLRVAVAADDTRRDPRTLAVETPAAAVVEKRNALLALGTLGALAFALGRRHLGAAAAERLALAAPLLASAAWLTLFAAKASRIPAEIGFDARHHVDYVNRILTDGSLPRAAEGWSTYHPPLFYALSALVSGLGGGEAALKALPLLAGLAAIWVAWQLARRLFPGAPEVRALAALFAATLPVSLYQSSYFSNESLHALLAGAALVATLDCLLAQGLPGRKLAAAGLLFGLAALTKFTALVAVPVAAFFLAWKAWGLDGRGPTGAARSLAVFGAVFVAVAGGFYLRNVALYGTPLVGNWALPGADQVWWQQPGFHTASWYAGFGESLVHPYYSGFRSFWDGLYSTFWGDGFVAGRASPTLRHGFWDYGFMSAGYWVALPATLFLLLGGGLLLRQAFGDASAHRRLALLFLATASWAFFLAFASLTAELPFFTQVKASYLLALGPVLALCFATGFRAADARLAERHGAGPAGARALLYAWLAVHAGVLFLAYAG